MRMLLKDGKSKVLTLSYDDGPVQDIRLIQIFDRYGIKATFNLNSGCYLPEDVSRQKFDGRMKASEAMALYQNSPHEVAAHGFHHGSMSAMRSDELLLDLLEDRKCLERQFGLPIRGMAYPYGSRAYNETVREAVKLCGFCYARSTKKEDNFAFPRDWLVWNPTCHHNNPDLMELAEKFVSERPTPIGKNWLFFVWGHSYEFDRNDNWDVIERFSQKVGQKEDIWYATNLEIYDYVKAYEALQTDVEQTMVYNPSVMNVWFTKNQKVYCVKGGETLHL